MTADNIMILATYIIACIALLLSLYILYLMEDKKETPIKKQNNAWDHYHNKAKVDESTSWARKSKGHWDY
jgi:hypothetical protein